jgi:hypothetical protein
MDAVALVFNAQGKAAQILRQVAVYTAIPLTRIGALLQVSPKAELP